MGETEARSITASEFRAKCLALMDEVAETGGEIVITKRGKPTARLIPPPEMVPSPEGLVAPFGFYKGRMEILGDIISPIDDLEWEEEWLKQWDELSC